MQALAIQNLPLMYLGSRLQRFLVLSGPAGSVKTATLHVPSRDLGFTINEWIPASAGSTTSNEQDFGQLLQERYGQV